MGQLGTRYVLCINACVLYLTFRYVLHKFAPHFFHPDQGICALSRVKIGRHCSKFEERQIFQIWRRDCDHDDDDDDDHDDDRHHCDDHHHDVQRWFRFEEYQIFQIWNGVPDDDDYGQLAMMMIMIMMIIMMIMIMMIIMMIMIMVIIDERQILQMCHEGCTADVSFLFNSYFPTKSENCTCLALMR